MKNNILTNAIEHWKYVAPLVSYPKTSQEFNQLISRLDELLKIVGENENHPLIGLVDIISNLVSVYEDEHYPNVGSGKGLEALKYLMTAHDLSQADLHEIASQGVLSEILNGKRKLNVRQIKALATRFNVTPATFIDD